MVNEVLQWGLLIVVGILVLGILRQVALILPPETRAISVNGPKLGGTMPRGVLVELDGVAPNWRVEEATTIAFLTESCAGCQRLLANLAVPAVVLTHQVVLIARAASPQFREALVETGAPTIYDEGEIWDACEVTATPLVVRIDREGQILAKGVTHRVDDDALANS